MSVVPSSAAHARRRPLGILVAAASVAALATVGASAPASSAASAADVVPPTVLLPNVVVGEGDKGTAAFVVNVGLSAPNPFDHPVTLGVVDYSAVPLPGGAGTYGTATPGVDYVAFGTHVLTFQPGQQVARFSVGIKGDTAVEPSEEIDVRFDDTVLTLGDNDIDLVLANDDGSPAPKKPLLQLPNQVTPEPDEGCYVYRVSIPVSKPVARRSTVNAVDFTTVPLPAPATGTYGSATPGVDYLAFPTRTLTYRIGSRVATLPVTICGDRTSEPSEEIDVRFDNTTTLAVVDNDIDLVLSASD